MPTFLVVREFVGNDESVAFRVDCAGPQAAPVVDVLICKILDCHKADISARVQSSCKAVPASSGDWKEWRMLAAMKLLSCPPHTRCFKILEVPDLLNNIKYHRHVGGREEEYRLEFSKDRDEFVVVAHHRACDFSEQDFFLHSRYLKRLNDAFAQHVSPSDLANKE